MSKRKAFVQAYSVTPNDRIIPFTGINTNVQDFIPFGSDNLFPNALALFARKSPNHRGVINSKVEYCMGDGLGPVDEKDEATKELLKKVNFQGESLNKVQENVFLDWFMTGNYWIELITDAKRSFLWFNHLDSTKCRLSKDSTQVLIHPNWNRYTGKNDKHLKTLPIYPNFEPDSKDGITAHRAVIHGFKYEPEFTFYGLPQYIAGKDSVQIDFRTNKWNLGRLKNSMRPGATMVVPVKDEEEGLQVAKSLKTHHTGEEQQGKTLLLTKSRALDNEKAEQAQYIQHTQEDKGSWIKLHEQSTSDIIVAHAWFRALTNLSDNTGFDTQRILNEYNVALSTTITTEQSRFVTVYQELYDQVLGLELPISFTNSPPLQTAEYKYVWEIRKERGQSFDPEDENQKQFITTVPSNTE